SIEVMTLVNVDPKVAVASLLDLAATWEKANGVEPGGLPAAQCSALAAASWNDSAGKPAHVPLGTLANIHHSPCFRARNLSREIRARGYKIDPSKHPTAPGGAWSTLLGQL